ncbi:putative LYR motif-containing protein 1 [Penaeus vannamei]|uniref:Putative LYR motif-containing protein 1 n=1 Tax=Penaeus vannamei TaxID=6689 RepID=A0A423SZG3_PENVA|nr:LYR motif containing protein 1-like [Penaeus vannamei]XP_027222345.1 LYR motif containing protein 1-like [Penaeus vannamei]XP_027222346.1 LYR motif containing protein 1-like [Penaeus vannamei]XP_027222347.1 LYR motif containing protein 1-like [Penaeus vannamei]ROT69686.1 putative LYR motif-containing protein 1 [Penaeus vannamei]
MANPLRSQVLSLYRRVLRLARTWEAQDVRDTELERKYITDEAQKLFRRNQDIIGEENIRQHIVEGESRLEIGLHYKSPYPRPVHMPPNTITMRDGKAWGQGNLRRQKTSRPIYVKSLDDET